MGILDFDRREISYLGYRKILYGDNNSKIKFGLLLSTMAGTMILGFTTGFIRFINAVFGAIEAFIDTLGTEIAGLVSSSFGVVLDPLAVAFIEIRSSLIWLGPFAFPVSVLIFLGIIGSVGYLTRRAIR